ncbi:MAG: FprA family A-type flavoprotein [Bacteroidales bacterium]|nr:FprA family A-type flavoprotein [Bacteroidales bacterium]
MLRQITPDIIYIGTDDLNSHLFESQYPIPDGMAYNSYIIKDDKTAILDTSDKATAEDWKDNLVTALKGVKPDYLVVHHLEPDHSALIAWAMKEFPGLTLVASARAIAMVPQFFEGIELEGRTLSVKEGDVLDLGRHSLQFFGAPMVHWPEVMVSFEPATGTLFSADAFGKFGALFKCGYTDADDDDWACEGRRYYFNICGKYGGPVQTLLKKLAGVDVKRICALHGPILENPAEFVKLYDIWSSYGVESEGVFVAYASIHGGTAAAAEKFAEILKDKGCPKVVLTDLSDCDQAEAVEDAFRYGKLVVAASSYDAGLFPPAYSFIHHLQDKAWQKRRVGLIENGSWAPSAGRVMKEMFSSMKDVELVEPLVTIKSTLKEADVPALEALADAILK